MFMKKTRWGFLLAFLFATPGLNSTVVRTLDVASLTNQADLIVVGEAISVVDHGPTTIDFGGGPLAATDFIMDLRADQVIKGAPHGQTLTVDFTVPQTPVGIQGVISGQYGMFFLSTAGSRFRFTDPMYPSLPAFPIVKVSPGSALNQVTSVLGQVLESTSASESDRLRVLDGLGRLKTDVSRATLRHALNSPSRGIQLDTARTLVASNDSAGLALVENALLHPEGLSEQMVSNLAGSLAGLKDPRSIPTLRELLKTHDQQITRSAAIALRQSGSAEALGPLSGLLGNSEERVRYYAVVGMGEITGQDEWTPAFDEFHDHEAKYLAYWRDWAQSNLPSEVPK
jgi:HEAT repeats